MDAAHHIFVGAGAVEVGAPVDRFESSAIQWVPLADVPVLIANQDIISASTMAALLLLIADEEQTTADTAHAESRQQP